MIEEWKDIDYFIGLYQISNLGKVKSIKNNIIRKEYVEKNRYSKIILNKNGKKYMRYIHRLIAIAFIDNPMNKKEVNHIDGNKQNNHIDNLEWVTPKENIKHSVKIKHHSIGEKQPSSKLTEEIVKYVRKNYKRCDKKFGCKPLAIKFGVHPMVMNKAINHVTWKHV